MPDLIWITGAGRGIGRALALRLARDGATVAVSARSAPELEALADEARGLPGRIVPLPLDVTDRTAHARALDTLEQTEGLPDTVVLNAGTHRPMPAGRFDATVFDDLFRVNLDGVVNGLAAIVPRFVERRRGRIAVVSSIAGTFGLPTAAAYGASKAAVTHMCEALRPDLAQFGVVMQVVTPGFVRTPLTDRNTFPMPFRMEPDAAADRIARGLRSRRFEITFPRRFTWMLKLIGLMPYPVQFFLTRLTIPDEARPAALAVGAPDPSGRGSSTGRRSGAESSAARSVS